MTKYINKIPCDTCGNRQKACCECYDYSCYSKANILEPTPRERRFIVSESDLIEMLEALMEKEMNERDGVGNWEWYGESHLETVRDFYPESISEKEILNRSIGFRECAKAIIEHKKYDEVF